jgi:hypothetical protein
MVGQEQGFVVQRFVLGVRNRGQEIGGRIVDDGD